MFAKLRHLVPHQRVQHGYVLLTEEGIQRFSPPAVQVVGDGSTGRHADIKSSRLDPVFVSLVRIRCRVDAIEEIDIVDV